MKAEDTRWAAKLFLGSHDGIGDLLRLVRLDLIGELQCLLSNQVAEAVPDARKGRRVVGQHSETEGDQKDQIGEAGEVEATMAVRSGQGGFHSKPYDQDHRQAAKHIQPHGLNRSTLGGKQLADGLAEKREWVLIHRLPSGGAQ